MPGLPIRKDRTKIFPLNKKPELKAWEEDTCLIFNIIDKLNHIQINIQKENIITGKIN